MKSIAILAALAGSTAAFAPAQVSRASTSINGIADMVGGEGPEPMPFAPTKTSKNFDPAGFAEVCENERSHCFLYGMDMWRRSGFFLLECFSGKHLSALFALK